MHYLTATVYRCNLVVNGITEHPSVLFSQITKYISFQSFTMMVIQTGICTCILLFLSEPTLPHLSAY